MNPEPSAVGKPAANSRPWRRAFALAAAALVAACGGGGDVAGVGTGGTGSFTVGTVTGFGSVFVNGVRYEDDGARLVDDDGTVTVLGSGDNPLEVGMVVEVTGTVDDTGTVRTATQIAYGAEIKGPVTAVDAVAGSFDVFGITVRTTTATVYRNFGGVASLAAGQVVEVHGQPDSAGRIVATFVEREATSAAAYAASGGTYRLRGPVAGLADAGAAYTFTVRGVGIRTDGATRFDGVPADGAAVSVRLKAAVQGDGRYLAERVRVRLASFDDVPGAAEGEVEGYVSAWDAAAGTLRVGGYAVRLGTGVVYEHGVAADLNDGIRVEAEGRIEGGVLVASKVEFKSRDDDGDGDDDEVSGGSQEFEFKGTAACAACGAGSGTFTVKGVSVRYDARTEFRDGLGGTTLDGKRVEVKCVAEVSAGGTAYRATRIERED